jgi:hypothetical protein
MHTSLPDRIITAGFQIRWLSGRGVERAGRRASLSGYSYSYSYGYGVVTVSIAATTGSPKFPKAFQ